MSWLITKSPVVVYADGSCLGKKQGGCGGWATIVLHNGTSYELFGGENNTTNNRMEMIAVIRGLQSIADRANVYVYTDSQYVQKGILSWVHTWKQRNWLTQDKRPVLNKDLWQILDIQNERHTVSWQWVRGHNGDVYNERCDALAYAAARKRWSFSGQYDKETV